MNGVGNRKCFLKTMKGFVVLARDVLYWCLNKLRVVFFFNYLLFAVDQVIIPTEKTAWRQSRIN